MRKSGANKFSLMTNDEMIQYLRQRYLDNGISALSYPSLKKEKSLYYFLNKKGIKLKAVIAQLGLVDEYQAFKTDHFTKEVNGKVCRRWSWKRVLSEAEAVVKEKGFLPPAQWFQSNDMSSLVYYVYEFNHTWDDLRAHFNSYENSDFIESRNGMRWRSHPEASLSNYLYARGTEHKKGEKYPDEYSDFGEASYGYYDLHFKAANAQWIDVEVWGDKPNGHNEAGYQQVREAKEAFNAPNNGFIGLHYADCFKDERLDELLSPFIGVIAPYVFDKPNDKIIQSTHWSNADELIDNQYKNEHIFSQ